MARILVCAGISVLCETAEVIVEVFCEGVCKSVAEACVRPELDEEIRGLLSRDS